MSFISALWISALGLVSSNPVGFNEASAIVAIESSRSIVSQGYSSIGWDFKDFIYMEIDGCVSTIPGVYGRYTCDVCSIDDISGLKVGDDKPLPSYAVTVTASRAEISVDGSLYRLRGFTPFASNYRASNREYIHRASLLQLKEVLQSECRELKSIFGSEMVIRG